MALALGVALSVAWIEAVSPEIGGRTGFAPRRPGSQRSNRGASE
jgi:hypothetical protein